MNNFTYLVNQLTGKHHPFLVPIPNAVSDKHRLHTDAAKAFLALQKAAKVAGFNLQPASTFRDFDRQKNIWNRKFNGLNKVHDDQGIAIDLSTQSEWQKCQAILRWSAVPGASRHHWGSEIDYFDPNLLPPNQPLMLEPWEYQLGGYFAELNFWLQQYASKFDFYFPYMEMGHKKTGLEPWHLSYFPIATQCKKRFTAEILLACWENEMLEGKSTLIAHIETLFDDYIV